jgi:hypothetical protein
MNDVHTVLLSAAIMEELELIWVCCGWHIDLLKESVLVLVTDICHARHGFRRDSMMAVQREFSCVWRGPWSGQRKKPVLSKWHRSQHQHVGPQLLLMFWYINSVFWSCKLQISLSTLLQMGHAVAQLVEALHYTSEGRGFNSRWCHWNFSLT